MIELTDWATDILRRSHQAATRFNPDARLRLARTPSGVQAVLTDEPDPTDSVIEDDGFTLFVEAGLEGLIDKIIYTWEYGQDKEKPHPFTFTLMLDHLRAAPFNALFVGDNPDKDCKGARRVGMTSVRFQVPSPSGHDSSAETSDFVIDSLYQLPRILERMN